MLILSKPGPGAPLSGSVRRPHRWARLPPLWPGIFTQVLPCLKSQSHEFAFRIWDLVSNKFLSSDFWGPWPQRTGVERWQWFFHNSYFICSPSRKGRNDQPFLFRKPLAWDEQFQATSTSSSIICRKKGKLICLKSAISPSITMSGVPKKCY